MQGDSVLVRDSESSSYPVVMTLRCLQTEKLEDQERFLRQDLPPSNEGGRIREIAIEISPCEANLRK